MNSCEALVKEKRKNQESDSSLTKKSAPRAHQAREAAELAKLSQNGFAGWANWFCRKSTYCFGIGMKWYSSTCICGTGWTPAIGFGAGIGLAGAG